MTSITSRCERCGHRRVWHEDGPCAWFAPSDRNRNFRCRCEGFIGPRDIAKVDTRGKT